MHRGQCFVYTDPAYSNEHIYVVLTCEDNNGKALVAFFTSVKPRHYNNSVIDFTTIVNPSPNLPLTKISRIPYDSLQFTSDINFSTVKKADYRNDVPNDLVRKINKGLKISNHTKKKYKDFYDELIKDCFAKNKPKKIKCECKS